MDDDGPGFLVDLVDDSEVPAPRGEEAFELTSERFPDALGVLRDRSEDGLENGDLHFFRELAEVPEAFWSDLDLVRHLQVVLEPKALPRSGFAARTAQRLEEFFVLQDLDGFIEGLQLIRADENRCRPALARDVDALALTHDAVDKLGKVRLSFGKRHRLRHDWSEF